jgi:hypothetical protein
MVAHTAIDDFASSVTAVTYQQPVTFTGKLVEGGQVPPPPVANEPVQIELLTPGEAQYVTVATGTTGNDGEFTISATLPSGGDVKAVFAGDTGLGASYNLLLLEANHLPSRIITDPVPSSVPAGTSVVFSGTLQVQVDGTWQPFQGITPLTLTMEPYTSSQANVTVAMTTGSDGQFSVTEPVTETTDWLVDTSADNAYLGEWIPDYARSLYGWIYGVSQTQIVGFHLPAKEEAHTEQLKGLIATGTVKRWNGSSWVGLAYGWVQFYYRPKGSRTWRKGLEAETDAVGNFSADAYLGVRMGTSSWQARVLSAPDTLPSTSSVVTTTIADRTHFTGMHIRRTSAGSSISGQVTDLYNHISFSTLKGRKLRLYYRADGSKTWHLSQHTKVGNDGYFTFTTAESYGYRFKVVFPDQGTYLSSTSRTL